MAAIVLVDCNNFFVSCEELFDPSLKERPVCVLGNNDGCVIARSNPAKDLGVAMGMPYFIAKKKLHQAVVVLTFNPSTQEAEARGVWSQPGLHSPRIARAILS